tara:strand:+ start:400 stop:1380 length:981 start_codon:yes stop_codon:yes gene_type:complete
VAIVISGALDRFVLRSTLMHLIPPLRIEGYEVDFYAALSTKHHIPFHEEATYFHHLATDPVLQSARSGAFVDLNRVYNLTSHAIARAGGFLGGLLLQEMFDYQESPEFQKRFGQVAKGTVLASFPTSLGKSSIANDNLLHLYYGMSLLWDEVVKVETYRGEMYDYVLFLRDDTHWLKLFNITRLLQRADADVFILSCDARQPKMHSSEVCDFGGLIRRSKAEFWGKYFEMLLEVDTSKCTEFVRKIYHEKGNGCNSEMILHWLLHMKMLSVAKVEQSLLPFQRSVYVQGENGVELCFHKYCESVKQPLTFTGGNLRCTEWERRHMI